MIRIKILLLAATLTLTTISASKASDSLRYKVAQMIVTGFKGMMPSEEITQLIKDEQISGVILFNRDVSNELGPRNIESPEQLKELTGQLQSLSDIPLLVSIDQEGGVVNRLHPVYGFPRSVSAAYLGSCMNEDTTRHYAAQTASTLVDMGINMNFAPCIDLNLNPQNPVIGSRGRSFGASVDSVEWHALMTIEEFEKRGIITSLKHFPGHGSSLTDSHNGLVDVTVCWHEQELEIYRRILKRGYNDMVMVGHIFNRNIDPNYPASLSKITIDSLLRRELGFDGIVITDDMNMGAIVDHYSFEKALELCVNAGVDMIILGNNAAKFENGLARRAIDIICNLVADGRISKERIDQAYGRVVKMKRDMFQ